MSLSLLAEAVREALHEATGLPHPQIVIGPPHEAAKQQEDKATDSDHLCVFFYRMGYSGFPTDAASDDPLYLSAFCLITALGGRPSSGMPAPGESELKQIGSVLECFHRNPVLRLKNKSGDDLAQLQIVPTQLSLDDINHLWATQNNTPYRLSLAYEFSLLPVPLTARAEYSGPRVQTVVINTEVKP